MAVLVPPPPPLRKPLLMRPHFVFVLCEGLGVVFLIFFVRSFIFVAWVHAV